LADKIIIMAHGNIVAIGNSLQLKSMYGTGFSLNIITSIENTEKVKDLIFSNSPESKLVTNNSGSILFNLPKLQKKELVEFVKLIEESTKDGLISEWGISETTLEEVYLTVTKNEKGSFN
jgi:ABC-type multidrug transport system ATPase subunit